MEFKENFPLKDLTTFRIGGPARYFCVAKTTTDLGEAVSFAKSKKLPFFVIGGGSNLLIAEEGYMGLVIKNEIKGLSFEKEKNGEVIAAAGTGENWDEFVGKTAERGLWGLENLSGIPGAAGGAAAQNLGAYGVEVKDNLFSAEVFDSEEMTVKVLTNADCRFGYRESVFKEKAGRKFIISKVSFLLSENGRPKLDYKDLKEFFKTAEIPRLSPKEIREAVLSIRRRKFPDLKKFGTAGSFFKNPVVTRSKFDELKKKFPEIPGFPVGNDANPPRRTNYANREHEMVKISLAWILDKICGLKGFAENGVSAYERQPLVIVAEPGAKFEDVSALVEKISKIVKEKTGIEIEREVETVENKGL